jgi:general secretion pathway protein D
MPRLTTSLRNGLVPVLLTAILTGCVEQPRRSEIAETIDQVSFAAPSVQPDLGAPGAVTSRPETPEPPLQAQIYPGRSRPARSTASIAQAQRSDDGVQLNFDRAEIREVAKVILGDILRVSYTVDPDVQGEVTLSSSAPLSERDLLAVLEAALRSNGASLVDTGTGAYQILPLDAAIGRSEVVPLGGRAIQVRPGYGITIVPLRNISSTTAAQFIQPLVGAPEDIRIDPARNAILFTGTAAERQNVVETLADLDVDWMAGKSIGLFPLERGTAEAIIPELQAIFSPFDPTGAEPPLIRFLPIARMNAVLAVGTDPEQVAEVDRWVRRLDHGQSVGPQFYVYNLKHAGAEDVAKLLNETFGDASSAAAAQPGPTLAAATTALGATQPGFPEDGGDQGAPPDGGFPPGASPPAEAPTSGGGSGAVKVVASKANNALVIRATPESYEAIEGTLLRLDTAPWQVLIEATIAEVVLNDRLRYGVQYYLQTGSVAVGFNSGVVATETRTSARTNLLPLGVVPGFNFLLTPGGSNITIDALSRIANVRVLSSPSVVVQDNSEALLTVGEEVPTTTRQATNVAFDPNSATLNSIEYRDVGVILQVRPRINSNQAVSLEIAQEVSRVRDEGPAGQNTPTFTQRKITSRVSVQSGQTVVLGGLIQEQETRARDRIPVLGEIPVIGNLFGATLNDTQRTELIVFITPRVIRNPEDARDVSNELRSRLKALRPAQAPVAPLMPNVGPGAGSAVLREPERQTEPGPRPLVPQPAG